MTTPERFRRRQFAEGMVLILLGIGMLLQTAYFNHQDQEQRRCLGDNFAELTVTLTERARLASLESEANKRVWLVYAEAAGLIRDDPTKPVPPEDVPRLQRELVAALLNFQRVVDSVEDERENNPVPPYPVGSCQQ